jgi:hypothetical protein
MEKVGEEEGPPSKSMGDIVQFKSEDFITPSERNANRLAELFIVGNFDFDERSISPAANSKDETTPSLVELIWTKCEDRMKHLNIRYPNIMRRIEYFLKLLLFFNIESIDENTDYWHYYAEFHEVSSDDDKKISDFSELNTVEKIHNLFNKPIKGLYDRECFERFIPSIHSSINDENVS